MRIAPPKMIIFDAGRTLIDYKKINIRKGIEAYFPYIISNPHHYTVDQIETYDSEVFGMFDSCRINRFEFVIASSDYGVMKPNRYLFQAGIVKSGLEAKDIWYVGDKMAVDVRGAWKPE